MSYIVLLGLVLGAMGYSLFLGRKLSKLANKAIELQRQLKIEKAARYGLIAAMENEAKLRKLFEKIDGTDDEGELNDILDDIINGNI